MAEQEILLCPFPGCDGDCDIYVDAEDPNITFYGVFCMCCHYHAPPEQTRAEAIAAHNAVASLKAENCNWEAANEASRECIASLKAEVDRLGKRDGNATISLSYEGTDHPFEFDECEVVDFGVADNGYVVTSPLVDSLKAQLAEAQAVVEKLPKCWRLVDGEPVQDCPVIPWRQELFWYMDAYGHPTSGHVRAVGINEVLMGQDWCDPSTIWDTREAAQAAKETPNER